MRFISTTAVAALTAALLAGSAFAADTVNPGASQSITRQAYLDHAGKRFDAMDKNHDGTLSSDERKAAHHGKRHARGAGSTVAPSTPSTPK